MLHTYHVLDTVLADVERCLAQAPPEWGGALLGFPGRSVITRFVFDDEAETSGVTYRPSRTLNRRVQLGEQASGLVHHGILHCHPRFLDRPSGQDEAELAVGLDLNPHMPCYLAPIATHNGTTAPADHELALPSGKISFYAGYRTSNGPALVRPVRVLAVPFQRDLQRLADALGAGGSPAVTSIDLAGTWFFAADLTLPGDLALLVLATEHYPTTAPLAFVTPPGGAMDALPLRWDQACAPEARLLTALAEHIAAPGPYRKLYGPSPQLALTDDPDAASLAGWQPIWSGADVTTAQASVTAGLTARSQGLLSARLQEQTALIGGTGSVGSYIAEQLVRGGLGRIILLDPESVEAANLSRTPFTVGDIGAPKVLALARRLLAINPSVKIMPIAVKTMPIAVKTMPIAVDLLDLQPHALAAFVQQADLIIAATDDVRAQRALNRFAYAAGKPALFIGLYAGAQGGEVIMTRPEQTACYLCATTLRHQVETESLQVHAATDYDSGRLVGQVALAADIQHVASAAVKVAFALLANQQQELALSAFLTPMLSAGANYLTLSMAPDYWFYPGVFRGVRGQYAYQAVWLTPTRRPVCPVCGDARYRRDPLTVPLRMAQRPPLAQPGSAATAGE